MPVSIFLAWACGLVWIRHRPSKSVIVGSNPTRPVLFILRIQSQLPTAEARWLATRWIEWSKIAPARIGCLTAAMFLMLMEAMTSGSPSRIQEMHLNRDRSDLFLLVMAWQLGHSLLVLCGSITMRGIPVSLALYCMNDLSWWNDHELWMYMFPFLTVVLTLMPSRFSTAIAEEVPLASCTISLDITWLVFLATDREFKSSFTNEH